MLHISSILAYESNEFVLACKKMLDFNQVIQVLPDNSTILKEAEFIV